MPVPAHYPQGVRRALEDLLPRFAPPAPILQALVVYGSLARGTFREGVSDVNLALVLEDVSSSALAHLCEPLQVARRVSRVEPFLVLGSELERLTDVFPIKLLDIQRHHDLIAGRDAFSSLKFGWQEVRLRAEQELRNHQLRLRRAWVLNAASSGGLSAALKRSASSLVVELETLFWLKGSRAPSEEPGALFAQAAREFDLDAAALLTIAAFKAGSVEVDVAALFQRLMGIADRLAELVDRLQPR